MKSRRRVVLRALLTAPVIFSTLVLAGCAAFSPIAIAAASDPVDPYDVLYFQSQMAINQGDFEWGIEHIEPIYKDPDCPAELIATLAECYVRTHHWDESLEVASDLVERYPSFVPGWQLRSDIYRRRGKRDKAIADLESALELAPRHKVFLQSLGEMRLRTVKDWTLGDDPDDPVRALLDVYERLVEITRGREKVPFLIVLSSITRQTGDYELAIGYAEQAAGLDRRRPRPLMTLALAHEAAGEPLRALDAYRRALLLDGESIAVRTRINEILGKSVV